MSNLELAQCWGKEPFEKWADANAAARRMRKRGYQAHAYNCPFCGKVHVGVSPNKSTRMMPYKRSRNRSNGRDYSY